MRVYDSFSQAWHGHLHASGTIVIFVEFTEFEAADDSDEVAVASNVIAASARKRCQFVLNIDDVFDIERQRSKQWPRNET